MPLPTDKTSSSLYSGVGSLWTPADLSQGGAVDPSGPSFYPNGTIDLKGERGEEGKKGDQGEPGPLRDPLTLERIESLEIATENAKANFLDEVRLRIDGDRIEASHREELGATLRTDLGSEISAKFEEARALIIDGDHAEALHRDAMGATIRTDLGAEISAKIEDERTLWVSAVRAEATAREELAVALKSELGAQIDAKVTNAVRVVADDQHALAERVEGLEAGYTDPAALDAKINAKVSQAASTLAEADRALSERLDTAAATYINAGQAQSIATTTATAKVSEAQSAQATTNKSLSDRIGIVEASYVTAGAANSIAASVATAKVSDEASARTEALRAEAQARNQLAATLRSETDSKVSGAISDERSARVDYQTAIAKRTAVLEATTGTSGGNLNANPSFSVWPDGQFLPTGWALWGEAGLNLDRAPDGRSSASWCWRHKVQGNIFAGLFQGVAAQGNAGWYVIDADVDLASGTWNGAGITLSGAINLSFAGAADDAGIISPNQLGNRRWSKLFYKPANDWLNFHAMTNWDGFGTGRDAKDIVWHRCSIRPANEAEVKAGKAFDTANNASARVEALEYTTSNPNGAIAQRFNNVEAIAGSAQSRVTDEVQARIREDGALSERISSVFSKADDAQARVGNVEYAISNPNGAVAQRISNVEATAGGASSNASIALQAAQDAQGKLGQARVRLLADAGNGRAQLELFADSYGNNGADLTGNLRINGNLTVDGSINGQEKLAPNSVSNAVSTVQYGMQISNNVQYSTVVKNSEEIAMNYTGGRLRVDVQFECYSAEYSTGQGGVYARLMMRQSNGNVVPVSRDINVQTSQRNPYTFWVLTQSYVGATAFWLEFRLIKSSGSNAIYSVDYIQIMAEEAKR